MVDALDVSALDAAVDHDHVAKEEEKEEERSQPTMLQHFDRRVKQRGQKTAERKSPSRPVRTAQAAEDQDSTKTRPQRSAAKGTAAAERDEDDGSSKETGDDDMTAALLLQFLSTNGASTEFAKEEKAQVKKDPVVEESTPGIDHKDSAWEPSCHDGLLTYHDGRKRWYHCTSCDYFNDRLYHSKMHYDRIHVKQGKSMPRKRKYMEPAGSKASEGNALPPSTHKQPEPARTRTRRPGDKWLKTSSTDASGSGFRYVSLHEREAAAHHTAVTIAGDHVGLQKQNVTHAQHKKQDNDIPVSGDAIPSPNEIAKRAEALGLSTQEVTLYCWEPAADNVKKGIENGGAFQLFDPVYRFGPELPAASAHRSVAWIAPQQQPMTAAALMLSKERDSKELRWWWYNPAPEEVQHVHEDEDDVDNKPAPLPPMQLPTEKNLPSKPAAKTSPQRQKTVHVQTASANSNANDNGNIYLQPPNMMVGMGVQITIEEGSKAAPAEDASPKAPDDLMSAATVLQSVLSFPTYPPLGSALRNTYDKKGSDFKVRAARMDLEPKTKRVWRRWDHEEERRLRDAVLKLGTKDWSSIHEEMQTDRSIKQLQDHWNDTKNNRMSKV